MNERYQKNYASSRPQMYDVKSRKEKAKRMVATIADYYKNQKKLKKLKLLDVGASTGIIDNELSKYFNQVIGVDIDKQAIKYANKTYKKDNLKFKVDDAMNLNFKKNTFDVVICAQVYEHVPNDLKLMDEIHRVLKPRGICYFAALNKYWIIEPHYNLPFLSWLPKGMGNYYVQITGKSDKYYETLRSYWGLKKLVKEFIVNEYTQKILKDPKKYKYENDIPTNGWRHAIVKLLSPLLRFYSPTYFWILEKN